MLLSIGFPALNEPNEDAVFLCYLTAAPTSTLTRLGIAAKPSMLEVLVDIGIVEKIILAPRKLEYLRRHWLSALSLVVPALRVFRIVRVLRVARAARGLRLVKVVGSLNRGMRALGASMGRRGFGYVTATLATYFIGRDAEDETAEVAGAKAIGELKTEITALRADLAALRDLPPR